MKMFRPKINASAPTVITVLVNYQSDRPIKLNVSKVTNVSLSSKTDEAQRRENILLTGFLDSSLLVSSPWISPCVLSGRDTRKRQLWHAANEKTLKGISLTPSLDHPISPGVHPQSLTTNLQHRLAAGCRWGEAGGGNEYVWTITGWYTAGERKGDDREDRGEERYAGRRGWRNGWTRTGRRAVERGGRHARRSGRGRWRRREGGR